MPTVSCPTCNLPVAWTEASRWRPFCSERCKLIDLGAWAAERHAISGEPITDDSTPSREDDGNGDIPRFKAD